MWPIDPILEIVAGLPRCQWRTWGCGVMSDEDDWLTSGAPSGEKATDVVVAVGVVPGAPHGIIESSLHVHDDQSIRLTLSVEGRPLGSLLRCEINAMRRHASTLAGTPSAVNAIP